MSRKTRPLRPERLLHDLDNHLLSDFQDFFDPGPALMRMNVLRALLLLRRLIPAPLASVLIPAPSSISSTVPASAAAFLTVWLAVNGSLLARG